MFLIVFGAALAVPQLFSMPGDWRLFWIGCLCLLWGAVRLAPEGGQE